MHPYLIAGLAGLLSFVFANVPRTFGDDVSVRPAVTSSPDAQDRIVPGQEPPMPPVPEGGRVLVDGIPGSVETAGPQADVVRTRTADDPIFGRTLRIWTSARTPNQRVAQVTIPVEGAVGDGDVLHVRFWARTVQTRDETGRGRFGFTVAPVEGGPAAFLGSQVNFGSEWELFDRPINSRSHLPEDRPKVFRVFVGGTDAQTVEIGGLSVVNYGQDFDRRTLPFTRETYVGREPDAHWRAEAAERIERVRKGDWAIDVVDATGRPVPEARVDVSLTRHEYLFGTMVDTRLMAGQMPGHERYVREVERLFNTATLRLYWHLPNFETLLDTIVLPWLRERDYTLHGHVLIWPAWHVAPAELRQLENDPEALRAACRERVRRMVTRYKGVVHSWDVVNETQAYQDWWDILGKEEMAEWFRIAHEIDPDALLFVNENSVLGGQKLEFVIGEVEFLREKGAPVHGIGVQAHVGAISIPTVLQRLDRLGEANVRVRATEYDMVTSDHDLLGDYTADLLTAFFSHPTTDGFIMWGFWDGRHWLNESPLYYRDWTPKPGAAKWDELVNRTWHTAESGTTDPDGRFDLRGFYGEYAVTVTHDGRTVETSASLSRDGGPLRVTLE